MTQHTPGSWEIGDQTGHCGIAIEAKKTTVASVYLDVIDSRWEWGEETFNKPENTEALANARLIAAAPDLLGEMQETVKGWERREGDNWRKYRLDPLTPWEQERLISSRAAIAKATK